MTVEVGILGPLVVTVDGEPTPVGSPSQRRVLAVLACAHDETVSRDRLIDAIWGDHPPRSADKALMTYVSRLRRRFGQDVIVSTPGGYRLAASIDASRFRTRLRRAEAVLGRAKEDVLRDALALWRGHALGELADDPAVTGAAHQLEELRVGARQALGRHLATTGAESEAVTVLRSIVDEHPLREGAWVDLVRALIRARRAPEAARAARECRDRLAEVGLEPSEQLTTAEADAIDHRVDTHMPRDDRSVAVAPTPEGDLPRPTTSFVGRAVEMARIEELAAGDDRCLTLVGPGGVGKTRLAVETASRLAPEFADGASLCDLTTAHDRNSAWRTVARSVGAPLEEPLRERVLSYCAHRHLLIVLDNCEHLVDVAARLCNDLLRWCPDLVVVATSRTRLMIEGERVLDIAPLDPTGAAVELLDARAAALGVETPDDQRTAMIDLCQRLDGLPLAIEMAAAHLRSASPGEVIARLLTDDDVLGPARRTDDPRHQSLRAMMAWSVGTLPEPWCQVFRRLSAFEAAFSRPAAIAIAAFGRLDEGTVDGAIDGLVEHSLLTADTSTNPTRYRMLDTIRRSAWADLLASADADATITRFVGHYTATAETIGQGLLGPDERRWSTIADRDMPHLEAALGHAADRSMVDEVMRLPAALFGFAYDRLRSDVTAWATTSLAVPGADRHALYPVVRALEGMTELHADRLDSAEDHGRSALESARADPASRYGDVVLAAAALYAGKLDSAADHAGRAASTAHGDGDPYITGLGLILHALAQLYQGHRSAAEDAATELRQLATTSDAPTQLAYADYLDGEVVLDSDPEAATALFDAAITRARATGASLCEGVARVSAAAAVARHAAPSSAIPAFADIVEHWHRAGDWTHQIPTLRNMVILLDRLSAAEPNDTSDRAAVSILGGTDGQPHRSYGSESARLDQARWGLRQRLGDDQYEALHLAGSGLTPDDVIGIALETLTVRHRETATST